MGGGMPKLLAGVGGSCVHGPTSRRSRRMPRRSRQIRSWGSSRGRTSGRQAARAGPRTARAGAGRRRRRGRTRLARRPAPRLRAQARPRAPCRRFRPTPRPRRGLRVGNGVVESMEGGQGGGRRLLDQAEQGADPSTTAGSASPQSAPSYAAVVGAGLAAVAHSRSFGAASRVWGRGLQARQRRHVYIQAASQTANTGR